MGLLSSFSGSLNDLKCEKKLIWDINVLYLDDSEVINLLLTALPRVGNNLIEIEGDHGPSRALVS